LSKLQAEYKDKGVTFIGVNVWERPYNEGTLDKVAAFVEKQGERMAYTVAFDGKEAKTNKAWMEAAGQNGIPHAFIVNQDGIIAWMGHPMGMDEPLSKIVAKSWKIEDAMADAAKREEYEKNAKANEAKIGVLNKKINDAIKAKNWDDAMTAMDELKALMPAQMAGRVELSRFNLLLTRANQPERAYAMKETLLATKGVGDNAQILNDIAWRVLDDEKVITRNFDFALELATKANELSGGKDGMILDTLARAHFEKGNKAQAIELQEKALQLAKASAEADPETIAELEANLERYKGN
jgi:tetratricopeptide (TPR) repeat protein